MTTPIGLELVWADAGGTADPGDAKYQLGWVAEIPTFQNFNHVLKALDSAKLAYAEGDIYSWNAAIEYVAGARVERSGKTFYCVTDNINQNPDTDTTGSYWVNGVVFSSAVDAFTNLLVSQGVLIDHVNPKTDKFLWQGSDITVENGNAIMALNTDVSTDANYLFGNIGGKICVVNIGTDKVADGRDINPVTAANSFEVYHEGHKPTQSEVDGTIPENPSDGVLYGRRNGNWVKVTAIDTQTAPPPPVEGSGSGWYNLDDGTFYIDINDGDSSQWVPASPPVVPINFDDTLITADGSTTARDLSERFAQVKNVKDYGAVGDGVADDTEALKRAIEAARVGGNRVFLPTGAYYITETLVLPAQCWLEGELHFFRTNGDSSEIVVDTDIVAIQLQDYTLGHRLENLVIRYEGAVGSSTKPAVINQSLDTVDNNTASMGAHFENIYTRRFHTGFQIKAWSWQIRLINCWSEQHYRHGFYVQGDATSAALVQFLHCSAITGDISNNSIGYLVEGGNVILDNCRIENNAYGLRVGYSGTVAPDSTGANVTINNGYFEGNRQRDMECRYGSSIVADYVQCLHQNTGHTTSCILFSTGDAANGGSIIIQRLLIKSNNGNLLSYLMINEDNSHIWVNDCEILDLENAMQVSPYFSGRYGPAYIGFREHDFEIKGLGLNWQYEYTRLHHTNTTGWTPEFECDGGTFPATGGERYLQYDSVDELMVGDITTGEWYYKSFIKRPVEYNSTPNLDGDTYSMLGRVGVVAIRFTGNPSTATITIDESTMEDGEVFFVADGLRDGFGDLSATITINIDGRTYTNNPLETTFFKKVQLIGGSSSTRVVSWKG